MPTNTFIPTNQKNYFFWAHCPRITIYENYLYVVAYLDLSDGIVDLPDEQLDVVPANESQVAGALPVTDHTRTADAKYKQKIII